MVSAHYEVINKLVRTKIIAKRNLDYIHLFAKPIDREAYMRWRGELLDDMKDWDEEEELY